MKLSLVDEGPVGEPLCPYCLPDMTTAPDLLLAGCAVAEFDLSVIISLTAKSVETFVYVY
jgi:hypothetical protein